MTDHDNFICEHSGATICVTLKAPDYHTLVLMENGQMLFSIKPNGEIVRGPAFTTEDEASLRFWQIIQESFPGLIKGGA